MTTLARYEAARIALAEAHRVDEVKDIRDKAQAMAAYAKQAKDNALVEWATEIKVRAERRAGELLASAEMHGGGRPPKNLSHDATGFQPTLSDIGISRDQSSRWQKLAAIPEAKFEQAISSAKEAAGKVTTAALLRAGRDGAMSAKEATRGKYPKAAAKKPSPPARAVQESAEVLKLRARVAELEDERDNLRDTARELNDQLSALEIKDAGEQQQEILRLRKENARLDAEIARLRSARSDLQTKCNELIRQVKGLQRRKEAA